MTEVRHNIMLRDFYNDWLHDKKPLSCGTLSETEVKEYQEYLSKIDSIPQDSCITSFDAGFYSSRMISINNSENTVKEWVHDLKIDLKYKPEQECKCKRDDCFKNIKDGKCTDPFIIKHICKKFFAEKYKNR